MPRKKQNAQKDVASAIKCLTSLVEMTGGTEFRAETERFVVTVKLKEIIVGGEEK